MIRTFTAGALCSGRNSGRATGLVVFATALAAGSPVWAVDPPLAWPPQAHSLSHSEPGATFAGQIAHAQGDDADDVEIPDENLRAQVEAALGKSSGDAITRAEMEGLASLSARGNVVELTGLEAAINLVELDLYGTEVSDLAPLSGLSNLETLDIFDTSVSDLAPLSGLTKLTSLNAAGAVLTDIAPLSALTSLERLDLGSNEISDVAPLADLTSLEYLDVWNNAIEDIEALAGLVNLVELHLSGNPLIDVEPLRDLTGLRTLHFPNTGVADLSPVAGLTGLEVLHLQDNGITDIAPLATLVNLAELHVDRNNISDITALSGMVSATLLALNNNSISDISALSELTGLSRLDIYDNDITDLEPLAGLVGLEDLRARGNGIVDVSSLAGLVNLVWLDLEGNNLSDIDALSDLSNLESLLVSGNPLEDITALADLVGLTALHLSGCPVSDVTPLVGLTGLTYLDIPHTEVSDPSPLSALTGLESLNMDNLGLTDIAWLAELVNLEGLVLANNMLDDISSLSELAAIGYVNLDNNNVADISPLVSNAGLGEGDEVDLHGNPLSEDSIGVHIPALRERGVAVNFDDPAVAPVVSHVNVDRPVAGDAFIAGDVIHVNVGYTKQVTMMGRANLALTIGESIRQALAVDPEEFNSSDDRDDMDFRYTVQSDDVDADGISIAADALTLPDGAAIRDEAGNDLLLDLGEHAFDSDPELKVDGTVDRVPAVAEVRFDTRPQAGDTYYAGERIEVAIRFTENVAIPQWWASPDPVELALTIGTHTRPMDLFWHDGRDTIVFQYEVQDTDLDEDGLTIAADALTLVGTTIRDYDGNDADLDVGGHVVDDSGHKVDGRVTDTAPAVRLILLTSTPRNGVAYSLGETISGSVWFGKNVAKTGDVWIGLTIGDHTREARFDPGGASCGPHSADDGETYYCRSHRFRYVVQASDMDSDGLSTTELRPGGGTIRDRFGNDAEIDLGTAAIENDPSHKVDGSVDLPPQVTYVSSRAPALNNTFVVNEPVVVFVRFNEKIFVDAGCPLRLKLDIGGVDRFARCRSVGIDFLEFEYRVAVGDSDSDGITFSAGVEVTGGALWDAGGNTPDWSPQWGVFGLPSYTVDGSRDTKPPAVAGVSVSVYGREGALGPDVTATQNDWVSVRVDFDEYIEATDVATLAVEIGGRTRAIHSSAKIGRSLHFGDWVVSGDVGDLAIPAGGLQPALGGITDGSGNVADLDLGDYAVDAGSSYRIDGGEVDSSPAWQSVAVYYSRRRLAQELGQGERIELVATFDEPVFVDSTAGRPSVEVVGGAQTMEFGYVGKSSWRVGNGLVFEYFVQAGDREIGELRPFSIRLNGSAITDESGNLATLARVEGYFPPIDGSLPPPDVPEVEAKTFFDSFISSPRGEDLSFGPGELVDIPIYYSEPVVVTGSPRLGFSIGSASRRAVYVGGSGTQRLLFRYRVRPDDLGPIDLPATAIELSGGTIAGLDGDRAALGVSGVTANLVNYYFANGGEVPNVVVDIPDDKLRVVLEAALGKSAGAEITAGDLAELVRLKADLKGIGDLTGLEYAIGLDELALRSNRVTDVAPLADLTSLSKLDLRANRIDDISPLGGLTGLTTLWLAYNRISDVAPLAGLTELQSLSLSRNSIEDISPLSTLTELTGLYLDRNQISDISALSGMTALVILKLADNDIEDLAPLAGLNALQTLDLRDNRIWDVASLSGLANINDLDISANAIVDLSPLVDNEGLGSGDTVDVNGNPLSAESLRSHLVVLADRGVALPVDIPDAGLRAAVRAALDKTSAAPITIGDMAGLDGLNAAFSDPPIRDLTGIQFATAATELVFDENAIDDVAPLAGLTGLQRLFVSGNAVSDASPLAGLGGHVDLGANPDLDLSTLSVLTSVETLGLRNNGISDLSPIAGLTGLEGLSLADNRISDVSPLSSLTGLTSLSFAGNEVGDLSPVAAITGIEALWASDNAISDIASLMGLSQIGTLVMGDNSISDIGPLVANVGLGDGDFVSIEANLLDDANNHPDVVGLRGRGVDVVVAPVGGYLRTPLFDVTADEIGHGDGMRSGDCTTGQGSAGAVRYAVQTWKWQSRSDADNTWLDVDDTLRSAADGDLLCPYTPSEAGEYRLVVEMAVEGIVGKYASNTISVE